MSEQDLTWDPAKAAANLKKHGVSFEEAARALDDRQAVVHADHAHSEYENRFVLVGNHSPNQTFDGLLTVVFVIRGDTARIISARKSTRAEKKRYMDEPMIIRDAPREDLMLDDYGHLEGWKRNPFHFRRMEELIRLDPDVHAVFRDARQVNDALRLLIAEGRVPAKKASA